MKSLFFGKVRHTGNYAGYVSLSMKRYTYHFEEIVRGGINRFDSDVDESLEDVREAIALAASEALRTFAHSGWRDGTWTMEAKDESGASVCKMTFSATSSGQAS